MLFCLNLSGLSQCCDELGKCTYCTQRQKIDRWRQKKPRWQKKWKLKVDYETIFFNYCSAVTTYSSSSVWSISSPEQQVAVGAVSEAKKKKRRFSREGNPKLWGVYIDVLRCFSFPSTISKFVFFPFTGKPICFYMLVTILNVCHSSWTDCY